MGIFCMILLQIGQYSASLNKVIEEFKKIPEAKYVNVSVSVREVNTNSEIFAYQSDLSLAPASTFKLLSTAAVLENFGPEYRFQSDAYLTGNIVENVLYGNIVVDCNFNPAFGAKRFNKNTLNDIVNSLKTSNIKRIEGRVIAKKTDKMEIPMDWKIGDVGNYYGAFPSDFNYNENMFSVFFDSDTKLGDTVKIGSIIPEYSKWKIINKVTAAAQGTGDQVNFISLPYSKEIIAIGTIPVNSRNFEIKGSIPEPNLVFEDILTKTLIENGIEVAGKNYDNQERKPFFSESSPPISELIRECNYKSVNFLADAFGNALLQKTGIKSLSEMYKAIFGNRDSVNYNLFRINDASGLSPSNTISTSAMTRFLSGNTKLENFDVFFESIPIVGENGTVRGFDSNKKTGGRIHAKSGSIGGVKNLAGYFKNPKNELYAFGIYLTGLNDTAGLFSRNFYEKMLIAMIDIGQF